MTLAIDRWPAPLDLAEITAPRPHRAGVLAVWSLETAKLLRQVRVAVVAGLCLLAPFLLLVAVKVQSAVPSDTLFGQWLHESGFALPMVMVAFTGQWVLPLLASVVSGDIFSAEDRYGTWKTVLTRSRTRSQIFAGKALAALTYTVAMLALLAVSSLVAGLLLGTSPVIGLSGQTIGSGRATTLVVESWATQIPPLLGFCALGLMLSVVTRNSPVGMGGPLVLGLLMQLTSMINLPFAVRVAFLSTPFGAWHGLWVQDQFLGPVGQGLATSAVWFAVCMVLAWVVFERRTVEAA